MAAAGPCSGSPCGLVAAVGILTPYWGSPCGIVAAGGDGTPCWGSACGIEAQNMTRIPPEIILPTWSVVLSCVVDLSSFKCRYNRTDWAAKAGLGGVSIEVQGRLLVYFMLRWSGTTQGPNTV